MRDIDQLIKERDVIAKELDLLKSGKNPSFPKTKQKPEVIGGIGRSGGSQSFIKKMGMALVGGLTGHTISSYEQDAVHKKANMSSHSAERCGYDKFEARQRIATGIEENRSERQRFELKKSSLKTRLKELDRLIEQQRPKHKGHFKSRVHNIE